MSQKIRGHIIDKLPFNHLRPIADLIYFEGPLLSYLRDNGAQHYLYYWCDVDDQYNRWLIFRVEEQLLRKFLTQQITLRMVILSTDTPTYLVDMDDESRYDSIIQINSADLPPDYLPEIDTYYDASLSIFHDEQAARDLMVLMQRSLHEVQTKLQRNEEIVNPKIILAAKPCPNNKRYS